MYVQQLYTNCLSEAAYYIESDGQAAIIDPLRDVEPYLALAKSRGATITYIFETHFHADFVSGHIDLGEATGAPIIYGPGTKTEYPVVVANDGDVFKLGKVSLTALHTPGHTLESTCWLLKDETGTDHALFSGDTLFIGDVGRPDLSSGNLSSQELAAMLYDSLHTKIMPLADDVVLYPAHGAGSSCGKNMGPETQSTIGEQKLNNYALQAQTKEAFVAAVTEGISEAPKYFAVNARINQEGYAPLAGIMKTALQPLDIDTFKQLKAQEDVVLLDSRHAQEFADGYVPDSIGIGLEGRFAEWAGNLLPFDKKLLLVATPGTEEETVRRLARVGFDKFCGYLDGGFATWQQHNQTVDLIITIEPDELAMDMPFDDRLLVVDVRTETEFGNSHVVDATNIPLAELTDPGRMAMLPEDANLYLHCAGGYRSIIAASLFKQQGIHNVRNVAGGYNAIKLEKGIATTAEQAVLN
ncbi:MAG: MBL fold metallo-hydrolase [Bacteroidetes bacterium]|nr:MAG: MBL fold metallo-hydrolase [Bacteroidota bacterium]